MKRSEFNARIAHVHKVRAQQRAVRNKVASISGPPTYIRQMANESVRKARFNAMGEITFRDAADTAAYKKAKQHLDSLESDANFDLSRYKEKQPGLVDDPKVDGLDDDWSLTQATSTPNDPELYKEARLKIEAQRGFWRASGKNERERIIEEYKKMVRSKHGMNYPPFQDSTMQVSRQEFERNKVQEQRTKDLSEIQDAINKLNRSLTAINEQIALNEGELIRLDRETELAFEDLQSAQRLNQINPQATTFQDVQVYNQRMNDLGVEKQVYNALMNGDANSVGLRTMAKETRRGIAALENQKRRVQSMLGMNVKGMDDMVKSAENRGLRYGGLGGAVFGAGALVLAAIYFSDTIPSTGRGRGRNPLDIFG